MNIEVKRIASLTVADVLRRSVHVDNPRAPAILESYLSRSIYTWAGTVEGETACVFGVIAPTILSEEAYLWLLITELVDEHKFLFIRYSQRFIEELLEDFPRIVGEVEANNARAIRWLRFLGARLGAPQGKAISFVIRAKRNG